MMAIDRERLAKLCGMFGSDHAGERANAAAAADRLVRHAGLQWPDVILPALPPPPAGDTINAQIEFVLGSPDALTAWERSFATSLAGQKRPPSEKQRAILRDLVAKCRRAEAHAS